MYIWYTNKHTLKYIFSFKPEHPLKFVEEFGFQGRQDSFYDIAQEYERYVDDSWRGYVFVDVMKK